MSALELTIYSDNEEETIIAVKKDNKKNGLKRKNTSNQDDDDNEDDFMDMNDDFEFGGLLGEDGHENSSFMSTMSSENTWSYKEALNYLEKNDSMNGRKPARTNVASIIAAARRNLKKGGVNTKKKSQKDSDEHDEDSSSVKEVDEQSSDGSGSDGDSSSNIDDSDDEEGEDDDQVDDVQEASNMQDDIIIDRKGKSEEETESKSEEDDNDDNDDHGDDHSSEEDDSDSSTASEDEEDEEAKLEAMKAAKFFDTNDEVPSKDVEVFAQLNLSRPLLRGVASIGFVSPTPIQSRVIPIALTGRDICASAQTGSGKTAAFLLPIMERILQRGGGRVQLKPSSGRAKASSVAATKGLILTPTRELAAQCLGMMTAMAKYTGLRALLIVGGAKNVNAQAAELRTRPDVVVATPGRLLDHITNSAGVDFDDVEFLILDEADRLLDLGFQEEVHEIIKSCPVERQTLLFSATMGTKVDELVKLSLKRPVRIHVTDKKTRGGGDLNSGGVEVANRLEQEFVRVRSGNEGVKREAMLLSLLTRTFKSRVIVFFDTKADAHRLMIVAGLCGIKCAELHGNLTQIQRLQALEQFREGSVDVLFATDLAARGLDISSVKAVINFEMPPKVETYVHRIGRTARAGRGGQSCTLIGEGRRHLMKEVMKDAEQKRRLVESSSERDKSSTSSTGAIRSRTIPPAVIMHFNAKILSLQPHIKEVLAAEAVARMDRIAEMEAMKAQNIIEHWDEIKSRPQREWYASAKEKAAAKEAAAMKQQLIQEKAGTGMHRMTRQKRRLREAKEEMLEMQREARESFEETGQRSKKILTENSQKSTAKSHKKQLGDKVKEKEALSLYDEDQERKAVAKAKAKSSKKKKRAFASDAFGDSSLFEDERIVHSSKRKGDENKPAQSSFDFKGYDPDKALRKHKKRGHHSFKSKSKYKRRK